MIFRAMNEVAKHDIADITKVWGVNLSALTASIWGNLIEPLQVLVLLVALGYNIWKWYKDVRNDKNRRLEDIEQGEP